MRRHVLIAAVAFSLLGTGGPAGAQALIDSYVARLSPDDHFNSNGVRLTNAAAIIRQDRANFYGGASNDSEDRADSFFNSKANRARLERMLRNGTGSRRALKAIVDRNPLIEVRIYKDAVEVELLD